MTNLRSLPELFRFLRKIAAACAFAASIAIAAAAQTNTFPSSGNAGLGTTSPNTKLEVVGNDSDQLRLTRGSAPTTQYTTLGTSGADFLLKGVNTSTANHVQFRWQSQNNSTTLDRMIIDQLGNVGIGTTNPSSGKLQIQGSDNTALFYANIGGNANVRIESVSTHPQLVLRNASSVDTVAIRANGDSFFTGGSVGIGTTTAPSDLLELNSTTGWAFRVRYAGDGQYLRFSGNQISAYTAAGTPKDFYLNVDGGKVGIGNSSPSERLHVTGNGKFTGNLTVDGNINAKYQDLAEWVPSSEQLSAGTVVVLDTTKSNQVVSSNGAYDTRVAGVISAQPGITLGESGEGKVLVATTGRVRVKVDASRGAIQIGDLLVTSDVSGVAMKSQAVNLGGVQIHRPGTIIGKALEPLAKGSGEILVLLSLQ